MQLCPEDVPGRFLQGQSFVGSKIEVKLFKNLQAAVCFLLLYCIVPGGEQYFFSTLLVVEQDMPYRLCLFRIRICFNQSLNLGTCPSPVTIIEQPFNMRYGLIDSFLVGSSMVLFDLCS